MKVPFGTITIADESKKLINEALASGRISSGKYVRQFEEEFAKKVGAKEAVAVSSGADADAIALAVLYDFGADRGDEIIIPALSFVATGNAVLHAGFKPVFVDIDRRTFNIDCSKIEDVITRRTKAIMPVHLMGKPADMDSIRSIAEKHGLFVIGDAAEAHGALYKGANVGGLGDMAAYSLYIAHIISTGEGGIITTNRDDVAHVLRSLRCHGRACDCKVCTLNTHSQFCDKRFRQGKDIRFVFNRIGFSSKMNELEAALGLGSMTMYDEILEKRRKNLVTLVESFKQFEPHLTTFTEEAHEIFGPHALPIIVSDKAPFSRDELVTHLEKQGIETRHLFSSMPTQCPGFSFLGYKAGDFPDAEYCGNQGLHIGVHQDLTSEHLNYVINVIAEYCSHRGGGSYRRKENV